jgi:DNA-binding CsgD family transcriptional regulator
MLTDKSTFFSSISLSDKERMVLVSYALGMGDTAICKTLKLSRLQLNQIAQSLLDKFCVQNQYHLVKKAYRIGYLDQSNFILEDIKTKTLHFIETHQNRIGQISLSEKGKWEFYKLLLVYLKEMGEIENKKIPPKRD